MIDENFYQFLIGCEKKQGCEADKTDYRAELARTINQENFKERKEKRCPKERTASKR